MVGEKSRIIESGKMDNKDFSVSKELFNPDLEIEKAPANYLEKQSELSEINKELVSHLEQAGIKDAIIYEPHNPEEYWNPNNTRIAFVMKNPIQQMETMKRELETSTVILLMHGQTEIKLLKQNSI